MCFQVLFKVVVQLEAAVALVAAEHVVRLGNLDLDNLDVLQHFGGGHRFLVIHNLVLSTNKRETFELIISCIYPQFT